MSEYQYTCELRQCTPILHFQHAQKGATLRATEVKPKLDRFLIGKMKQEGRSVPDVWKKKDTDALDYQLRLQSCGQRAVSEFGNYAKKIFDSHNPNEIRNLQRDQRKEIPGMYYGNMASDRGVTREEYFDLVDSTFKEAVTSEQVVLTVTCFHHKLLEEIKKYLEEFFLITNFGTNQSKGYGSFVINKRYGDGDVARALSMNYGASACYVFNGGNDPLGRISTIYKIMKSGLNLPNANDPNRAKYRRSLLFLYMHEYFDIGNEKAYLKQQSAVPVIGSHNYHSNDGNPPEAKYVRALLGVGDHLEFKESPTNNRKMSVEISDSKKEIERFPSTVFFKVVDNKVFFVGKRIPGVIFNKEFSFSGYKTVSLSTPEKTLTDVNSNTIQTKDFMDGFLHYCYVQLTGDPPPGENSLRDFMFGVDINLREVMADG